MFELNKSFKSVLFPDMDEIFKPDSPKQFEPHGAGAGFHCRPQRSHGKGGAPSNGLTHENITIKMKMEV